MVRTDIASPVVLSTSSAVTAGQVLTFQAADGTNNNAVTMSGRDLLVVRNTTGGGLALTIQTLADPYGRTGNITETIAAGVQKVYGPFGQTGFQQADGKLYVDAAAGLDLAVIRLP